MSFQGLEQLPAGFVSVVIVNWNRRALLAECLASLARDQGVPFEVIVVDNGSTDDSVQYIQAFTRSAPYPLTLIENRENRGFCGANNQGIAAARGEFVALLNNDAEADPGWLVALLSVFADPGVGMAASKILVHEDPRIIDKVGHLIYPDGQNRGRGTGELDQGQYDQVEEVLWPDGCACMYRKSMLNTIGAFDEDLFAYGDDAELGLRARICGYRSIYTPYARVRHHRGATLGQLNPLRITLIERNRLLLAVKLFPGSLLWRNGAYYLARLLAGLWAALRKRGEISRFQSPSSKLKAFLALLKGDWQALQMLPSTLRKRRALKPLHRLSPSQVHQLILSHRISLKELSQKVAAPNQP
ncbi:glycosyltransferase family 2 protein [Paludibaculum fermentans]|uniref:Glycosyltransferase family 2 protein n=1 Tax=Paludibaculum fermentans TaxID=1473598 RepID=A0A7S7NWJ3_PALFE|nr:glycosyltransferase family 2 protein [Paludibaculum fermentans]QOY91065.1 glycosyltransferase family 2 protein [Paludibaculum fermentans]